MERSRAEVRPRGRIEFGARPPGSLSWNTVPTGPEAEDLLITSAFRHLLAPRVMTPVAAREMGRAMGRAIPHGGDVREMEAALEAFSHLGAGGLRLAERSDGHYAFEGVDLVGSERPDATSCALALGFVEGVASAQSGRPAMGAQMRCRARGHEACGFVVRTRA